MAEDPPERTQDIRDRLLAIRTQVPPSARLDRRLVPLQDYIRLGAIFIILALYAVITMWAAYVIYRYGLINDEASKESTDKILDLIKTAIMPIVTLSIGYYFGTRER